MVAARAPRRAYRRLHTLCLRSYRPDPEIGVDDVQWVAQVPIRSVQPRVPRVHRVVQDRFSSQLSTTTVGCTPGCSIGTATSPGESSKISRGA